MVGSVFYSFERVNDISSYGDTTFSMYSSGHRHQVLYTFFLKSLYKANFCLNLLSFLLGVHLGVELLGHMGTSCLHFEELPKCFCRVTALSYMPSSV